MDNLDQYSEITDLNFDGDNPHLAVCHKSQGYSANKRPTALLFKSDDLKLNTEIVKSLEGIVPETVLQKMSYDNKRKSLEEAIEVKLRGEMSANGDYVYTWVMDFSDDLVAFRYQEDVFAVSYSVTENGVVELGEEPRLAKLRDLYVDSETGEELIKASDWLKTAKGENPKQEQPEQEIESGDNLVGEDSPDNKQKEDDMSDKQDNTQAQDDVIKSADVQELIKQAIAADRKEQEELRKAQELENTTTELFKGFSFVEEDKVSDLVKAIVSNEQAIEITKALSSAQEKIDELTKSEKEAQEELTKVKEEFGKGDALTGDVKDKTNPSQPEDREAALMKAVQAQLEKSKK